jgi:hypothetical protein
MILHYNIIICIKTKRQRHFPECALCTNYTQSPTLAEQSESISHEPLFFLPLSSFRRLLLFVLRGNEFLSPILLLPFLIKRNGISVPAVVALAVVVSKQRVNRISSPFFFSLRPDCQTNDG